ncbi:MAG: energy coupling factor transporter S component ThiW [Thermoprotei archaeon]|nr:MAG: energy coupling factor transporter S component ThiW [Thermoprotei archaeon]
MGEKKALKIATAAVLTALGVVLAPFLWFPVLGSKAYPGQHLVNAMAGVLLGPWWASLIAFFIGVIRMSLGIGTIYSIPGGIPGALVVGLVHSFLKKTRLKNSAEIASLLEPIGTVLIGGTLALLIFAPALQDPKMLAKLEEGAVAGLLAIWTGWAISSVPGAIIGFIVLKILKKIGVTSSVFE